jgi:hypothetical protein
MKRSRNDYEKKPEPRPEPNPEKPWKQLGRSYEKIDKSDLEILLSLAMTDLDCFVKKNPKYKPLKSQIISICLCQGAALHYKDGKTGIRDFDVYIFFSDSSSIRYPVRRRTVMDFGTPKFGKTYPSPKERNNKPHFIGRNCDIMGRQIPMKKDYTESIQSYLTEQKSPTAYHLAQKAVVVLWPRADMGKIVW